MKSLSIFITLCLCITGCCPQRYNVCDNPPPLPLCPVVDQPVRLALVLGGGGAKGLAHVGVLEVLEEANIPIDVIIGCSAGSIVGAIYADCPSTEHLKEVFLTLKTNYLTDFNLWNARMGLCQGRTLRKFIDDNLDADTFDQLKVPFFLVTTDLYSSELVTIGGGPLVPAVEASCAIPFVFVPVELHGRAFVDGGVIDPVPVRVAHHFKPEVIVAVDLRGLLPQKFPTHLFGVATRSAEITLLWQSESCLENATVVIRPEVEEYGTFADECNEQIYMAGREAALAVLPKIKECLREAELKRSQSNNND